MATEPHPFEAEPSVGTPATGTPAAGAPRENAPADAPEQSMDDILASIRRILDEEGARAGASTVADPAHGADLPEADLPEAELPESDLPAEQPPDILLLEPSMMLPEPDAAFPGPIPVPPAPALATMPPPPEPERPLPPASAFTTMPVPVAEPPIPAPAASLVAPAAAAAAASSVGALVRTLATERGTAVSRSGPTLEDLVRDEMRPLLKEWLDTHLPPLVERLVRAEIERVISRSG